tara:strand:- start:2320 stop:3294 length:975 start_codon:yes stop_codon:yes gene_type:complete
LKKFIVADYSNFSTYGGVEKNAELITKDIEKIGKLKIKRINYKSQIFPLFFKSLFRIKFVDYFICYKNSILTGLFFKIAGSKLIIRVNNSPESYLYWFKLSSFFSHYLKIKLVKSEIILFNSKKIKNFYSLFSKYNKNLYFLNNNYDFNPIEINISKRNKIYLASRLTWEKNLLNTYKIFKQTVRDIDYDLFAFSTTKNNLKEIKNFNSLQYNFNDIYVSLSFFEGMPNMVFQALFKGSALLLSNCWSHVEIYNLLLNFGLANRIHIISSDYKNESCLINEIKILKDQIKEDNHALVQIKLSSLRKYLITNYKKTINEICKLIE